MGRNLLFLLFSLMFNANGSEENVKVELVIFPTLKSKGLNFISKKAEETLNVTCSAISETDSLPQYNLHWDLPFTPLNSQNRVTIGGGLNTLTLVVQNLKVSDSGDYNCEAKLGDEVKIKEAVTVNVKNKKSYSPKICNDKMFSCSPGQCIPRRYKCDGHVDCESGADEAKVNCGPNACLGRINCDDGRCIPKNWCCDQLNDPNCTAKVKPTCCSQWHKSYVDNDHGYLSEQQRYSDMGFLQTTIYTVIGCAMAFMFIVTILVVAICRVHMKRSSTLGGIASVTPSHRMRCSRLTNNGGRFPGGALPRNSATHSLLTHHQPIDPAPNSPLHSLQLYDLDVYLNAATSLPPGSGRDPSQSSRMANQNPHSLLVTYNINNGVQFVGRPVDPPPYCEVMSAPPREGPPPPYVSHEDISSQALNQMPSTHVVATINSPSASAGTPLNLPPPPSISVQPPQQSTEEEPSPAEMGSSVVNIESQATDSLLGSVSEERNASCEHNG
ncbi:low-density lipoprotein receptor class A domain-containing protein 3-like [Hetaerina americana]|uniref:low-density lipoprotein receptor class A domain-containing protein 3-like n=1 Tax=Hetaerina americana TaxID=62018 RepID=UPI003A7F56B6